MVEQLFGSKTRVKLLQLFYSNPNRAFYVREITRKIDEQINSVRRELSNLLSIGIISSDTNNNRLYYEVNQKYEYYKPLLEIFGQTAALKLPVEGDEPALSEDDHKHDLRMLGNVELALYTGQFTRDELSGVDLMIVGDINQTKLSKYVADLEKSENKVLRYAVLTASDFKYRQQVKDRFLSNIMNAKKQVLIDKNGVFSNE
jgi:predicted transcriptional regulator with HTH domain